jgi:MOSC domain-containing protein YiiM/GNAT superfamily N-acetyltransferase
MQSDVTIVPVPGPDGEHRALFDAWAGVYIASSRHLFGDGHSAWTADQLRELWGDTDRERLGWVALAGGGTWPEAAVGSGELLLPRRDNLAMAIVQLAVHPYHRRQGIGTALLGVIEATATARGRSVLVAETEWRSDGRDDSGEGFAARKGYVPAQTVLRSTLALPADRSLLAGLAAGPNGDSTAGGYSLRTCWDGIPEEWLAGRAELSRRMSTDMPMGELVLEEEVWDEERVREQYARTARMGRRTVDTFAVHDATATLVGYTQIQVSTDEPEVAYQQDTLVVGEHRGHRLGLRMKAANTLALMDESPVTREVRTWNADDNAPMLAVNREVGYAVDASLREWQKVLPVVGSIHIAPGTRLPTRSVESVEAEAGRGLVGDRYHGSKHRHVTVQSLPDLLAAAEDLGAPVPPGSTRRNITISTGAVPTTPGARIRIGAVDLEVVRVAAPCKLLDDYVGPGARHALHHRAGSVFRLLGSGTIRVGDPVDLDPIAITPQGLDPGGLESGH